MNTELTRPAQRDPLHDWRVRAKASSVLADVALAADLPLVGREDILLQLERQAARAAAGGVSVVALTGEPGLGKTRVLRAFEERARARGVDVVWADAEPGIASRPAGPLVVLCDGVQAASRLLGSVDLSQEQVHQGALFVVAYSPGDVQGQARHPVHEWLAAAARRFELVEVDLPALSNPELAELMTHAGGGGPPDQELLHVLSSLSEGNPYFALQTLLDLTRSRLVSYEQSTWRLQGHLPVDYLPAPIASLAAHQTSALDAATAMTLASAAVIGPGFQFDLLVTICGKSPEEVLGHLEDGLAHEIIREAAEPPDDFHFVHELVRRSLYRHLSSIRRRQLHQAIASALESESAGSKAEEPDRSAVLAHHYGRGRDPELAFHHTLRALHRAESLGAWEDAVRRCREALEFGRLAECGEDIELQLLTHLGGLYLGRAQTFAAGTCWREALRICDSVGDLHRRAVLMAHLAALGPGWLSIEQAEGALVEAESAPQPVVGPAGLAVWAFDAYMNLGLAKERYGRMPEAMTYLRRAVDLTRVSDPWSRSGPR